MEQLSEILQPYKEVVGSVASVVTIGQFLAGGFICKDVYKKGSTNGISAKPFVGSIVVGILMLQYSLILNDTAMLTVNLAAVLLNILYLFFYIAYSEIKSEVFKGLGYGAILVAVLLGYVRLEHPSNLENRYGLIVTVLMLILIGSPLLEVKDVINKKDASPIPFPIVLSGTVVSFLWLLYGIILLNDFMIFQNVVGLILCMIQLGLCFMYPGGEEKKEKL